MTAGDSSRQAYWLLKNVNKAIREFDMIQDGDRIAVAVSGGKDSLSLLELLAFRLKSSPEKYTLRAIHILGDTRGPGRIPFQPLADWLESKGIPLEFIPMHIPEGENLPMGCGRCTWNRRRTIFETARQLGCNKVAFGHTADDLAQTTLLNLISSGKVETMAPRADYFEGEFELIRPLCYLFERDIRRFSIASSHPSSPPKCPLSGRTRRKQVAEIIQHAEPWCREIRINLLRAGLKGIDQQPE